MILYSSNIQAQQVASQKAVLISGQSGFKITQNSSTGFHFNNRIAALNVYDLGTVKGLFCVVGVEGYASFQVVGDPSLPVLRKLIEVPENAIVKATITKAVYKEYNAADLGIRYQVIPAQSSVPKTDVDPRTIPFRMNADTYNKNSYGDTTLVRTEGSLEGLG